MCFHGPFPTDLRELHRLSHGSPCIYYDLYRAVRCAVHTQVYVGPILADARISGLAKRLLAICTYSEMARKGWLHSKRGICRSRGPGLQYKETASTNGGCSQRAC